jgi:hypothetical protein
VSDCGQGLQKSPDKKQSVFCVKFKELKNSVYQHCRWDHRILFLFFVVVASRLEICFVQFLFSIAISHFYFICVDRWNNYKSAKLSQLDLRWRSCYTVGFRWFVEFVTHKTVVIRINKKLKVRMYWNFAFRLIGEIQFEFIWMQECLSNRIFFWKLDSKIIVERLKKNVRPG